MSRARVESDSLGRVEVPGDVYWGAQTQRCLELFGYGSQRLPEVFWRAYVLFKQAAAEVNGELGELAPETAGWIAEAAQEVLDGRLQGQFPLGIWQSGSGTPSNMNVNEVLANRASELAGGRRGEGAPVHPNDHVNRGQSTNDSFPSAVHLAVLLALREQLAPALEALCQTLADKAEANAHVLKIGRTHLQDATPLSLGQEIGGWRALVQQGLAALRACEPRLGELAAGGTAVGTGLNAHPRFAEAVAERLAAKTGLPLTSAPDKFAALAGHPALAELSGALSALAGSLLKLANDVRWLASGPRCGLGELEIPAQEPGSSIMPGKVNPSQAEALVMVCIQTLGHHTTVSVAASQGNFELNVCKPLMAHALLESIEALAGAVDHFDRHCARGLEANADVLARNVDSSLMLVTALAPHIGYEAAARIAQRAHRDGLSLREAAVASGEVEAAQFDAWVRPERMLGASED